MSSSSNLRYAVKHLYKQLLYLGRDYPAGERYFKAKLKNAFMKHRSETDPEKIKMLIARGEYVIKEVEALYMLRKYRTLKQRYYKDESTWQRRILNSKLQDYLPVWRNQLVWPTPGEVKGLQKNVLWSNWAKLHGSLHLKDFVFSPYSTHFIYMQSVNFRVLIFS